MVNISNPSTLEAEAGVPKAQASLGYTVSTRPYNTLSQKKKLSISDFLFFETVLLCSP